MNGTTRRRIPAKLWGFVFAAVLFGPVSSAHTQPAPSEEMSASRDLIVVRGKVLREKLLCVVGMDGLWRFEASVEGVLEGELSRRRIEIVGVSHTAIPRNQEFVFHLRRRADGDYDLVSRGVAASDDERRQP